VSVIPSSGKVVEKISITSFDSNTLYVGGNGTGNYSKIQDAIDNSSDGDTVFVYNGTYYENVKVDKSINLTGQDKDTTIIDCNESGDVIYVSADWVNISGFKIQDGQHGGYPYEDAGIDISSNFNTITGNTISNNSHGIKLDDSWNNTILGNTITSNKKRGIYLDKSESNTIIDNIVASSKFSGVFFNSSINNTISNNKITDNLDGVYLIRESSNNTFIGNDISENNNDGIYISDSSMNNLSLNTITDNADYGIKLSESYNSNVFKNTILRNRRSGIVIDLSYDIFIEKNTISESFEENYTGKGISLMKSWNISISNNYISDNVIGIIFVKSSSNQIFHNVIINNTKYGIYFWPYVSSNNIIFRNFITNNKIGISIGNSNYNRIDSNNFIGNQRQAKFISCKNTWEANYWNRIRFLPKPIFGRLGMDGLAYNIPWIQFDWHPAQESYDIGV